MSFAIDAIRFIANEVISLVGWQYFIGGLCVFVVFLISEMIPIASWVHKAIRGGNDGIRLSYPPWLKFFIPQQLGKGDKEMEGFVPPMVFRRPMVFGWFMVLFGINCVVALVAAAIWPVTFLLSVYPIFNRAYEMVTSKPDRVEYIEKDVPKNKKK